MLQLRSTRIIRSLPASMLPGAATPNEEGVALVYAKEQGGETFVQMSTGTAGEKFAGLAMARNLPPETIPMVEEVVLDPATGVATLARAPKGSQISVYVAGAFIAKADFTVAGNVLTSVAHKGKAVRVLYRFVPTYEEARAQIGDMPFGGNPIGNLGAVNVLKVGEVGTSMFDASADWSSALGVKLAAGGLFAPAAAGEEIPGVVVMNSPNSANSYLVLNINVA